MSQPVLSGPSEQRVRRVPHLRSWQYLRIQKAFDYYVITPPPLLIFSFSYSPDCDNVRSAFYIFSIFIYTFSFLATQKSCKITAKISLQGIFVDKTVVCPFDDVTLNSQTCTKGANFLH